MDKSILETNASSFLLYEVCRVLALKSDDEYDELRKLHGHNLQKSASEVDAKEKSSGKKLNERDKKLWAIYNLRFPCMDEFWNEKHATDLENLQEQHFQLVNEKNMDDAKVVHVQLCQMAGVLPKKAKADDYEYQTSNSGFERYTSEFH
eukprot:gene994-346_t